MTHKALIRRLQISCLGLDPVDPLRLLVDDVIEALAQPKRTWVGLTDEEILHRIDTHVGVPSQKYPLDISDLISFARAIEHESKGKNT